MIEIEKILIVNNSNFFTIISHLYLQETHQCEWINLRYNNKEMEQTDSIFQQIEEIYLDYYYEVGMIKNRYHFNFTKELMKRIENTLQEYKPDQIIMEIQQLYEEEILLIKYIRENTKIPLIVFMPKKKTPYEIKLYLKKKYDIYEIIHDYTKSAFQKALENAKLHSTNK